MNIVCISFLTLTLTVNSDLLLSIFYFLGTLFLSLFVNFNLSNLQKLISVCNLKLFGVQGPDNWT
jgi:hypothetical protein